MSLKPPHDPEELRATISAGYESLSKRLKQIARFALDHPNDMALETIAVIAERAAVQPSALVRFAKAFGYSGFSDMQRVFQVRLAQHSPSYSERIRLFQEQHGNSARLTPLDVLREFAAANVLALEHLSVAIPGEQLEHAVDLLTGARHIYAIGQRRSFPVAAYLTYALSHVGRHVHLLDGVGGLLFEQSHAAAEGDVLVAISFPPYAPETVEVAARLAERGVAVIAFTDSPLSPVAAHAMVSFEIKDAEVDGFRSLSASLCVAQSLAMGLGLLLERDTTGSSRVETSRVGSSLQASGR